MAFLRFQVTAVQLSTDKVVFSSYLPTWHIADFLMKGDKKFGLDIAWSIVPVHISTLPDKRNDIDLL